jgi:hypothetical protein
MDENQMKVARELVAKDEEALFEGYFSERVIRADLSTRREKRGFYIETFNKFVDDHRTIMNAVQGQDSALAAKSEKCKKEASRLLDIVYEY